MSRGKKLAKQMNAKAASPEGQERAKKMKRCDWCGDWYSEDNAGAVERHEGGHCS